jgi:dihydrofolate synthase/folylpolyglutamate synthase
MSYSSAVKYLETFRCRGIRLGLKRVEKILSHLGDPQNSFKTIHIAGTNGKGSAAAMLSSILTKAGYRTGLYTSPHLVDYTERIRINEKDISRSDFAKAVDEVKKAIEDRPEVQLTEFEVLTVAGFVMLRNARVKVAVIEVGLGGRFDATNVLHPILTIITNIGYDHMDLLGKTLPKIAFEKGGIIKSVVPMITGESKTSRVLKAICKARGARFIYAGPVKAQKSLLLGEHQKNNEGLVLEAVKKLNDLGLKISKGARDKGLRGTRWEGRLQVISRKPLFIVDGAHNVAGAMALSSYLKKFGKKFNFVIGMQRNKDIKGYIKVIKGMGEHFYVVQSSNPGSMPANELAKMIGLKAKAFKSIRSAIKSAKLSKLPLCLTGSLYLVGDFLKTSQ